MINIPKVKLNESFELHTRNTFTKVDANVSLDVEGRKLPSMAVLGGAVEDAIALIRQKVAESYKVVPERTGV